MCLYVYTLLYSWKGCAYRDAVLHTLAVTGGLSSSFCLCVVSNQSHHSDL